MYIKTAKPWEEFRLRVIQTGVLTAFCFLVFMLWRIQIAYGIHYKENFSRQCIRKVRLPGIRGRILDRHGVALAENRPSYDLSIHMEELRRRGAWSNTIVHVEEVLERVSKAISRPPAIDRDDIWNHIRKRLPLSLCAWRDMDQTTLARWAEQGGGIPGITLEVQPMRVYPQTNSACHVIGYVGRAKIEQDAEQRYHYYLPEVAGVGGIEKVFDQDLRGEAGGEIVRVDVSGYRRSFSHDEAMREIRREPRCGRDVVLSLDARIQRAAETAMSTNAGAVVVIDPRNGDVLAMVSVPAYDLNAFIPIMSRTVWRGLLNDPQHPLINKACSGHYAAGSIFKPIVAMAALQKDADLGRKVYHCPGYFNLGRAHFRCWQHYGHGDCTLQQALKYSCNVYFYRLGLECGPEHIQHMARAVGLGSKTGIALDGEKSGLVPDNLWKRANHGDRWRDGDTCNLSIGQGALDVTPLQMAVVAATLANGGYVYRPRLVLGVGEKGSANFDAIEPEIVNNLHWPPQRIGVVRRGMRDVVMAVDGTGRKAGTPGIEVAGKTGTAQYGARELGLKRGWMIAFAPFGNPRYAIALMVERAVSGGSTAAPKVGELLNAIFELEGRPVS